MGMKTYNINNMEKLNNLYASVMDELGYEIYKAGKDKDLVVRKDRRFTIKDMELLVDIYHDVYKNSRYELCYIIAEDRERHFGVVVYKEY